MASCRYILGIDVGVGSLGVALWDVDDNGRLLGIRRASAFIYPSGGDDTAERRISRNVRKGYRRRRQRLKKIRRMLCHVLGASSNFDEELTRDGDGRLDNNRIALRALGLVEGLSPDDLARAVMHIARNRGIRLTRLGGDSEENRKAREEMGQMARESQATRDRMAALGLPTPGAFLHALQSQAACDHARPATRRRRGGDASHRFLRSEVETELQLLLKAQAPHHRGLTETACQELMELVFLEHPQKLLELGPCRYFPFEEGQRRMRVASDLYQTKRVYEEVNNIRIRYNDASTEKLTLDQRDRLVDVLLAGQSLTSAAIKKLLGLKGTGITISLDDRAGGEGRELKGHLVRAAVTGTPLAPIHADPTRRHALESLLRDEKDQEVLASVLVRDYGLEPPVAWDIAANLHLPAGTAPMGPKAAALILQALRAEVISHTEAVERAGLPDPQAAGGLRERLPYYGEVFPHLVRPVAVADGQPGFGHKAAPLEIRYGRIPNPVVHKAFNAIRKVVNQVVKDEGPPLRIQIELARDMKKTQDQRDEDMKRIMRERKANERYDEITLAQSRRPSRKNRRRLRLAERQNWQCPYTGRQITPESLFDGTFDIDHVLPRSKTLDDSLGNLVVALEEANKFKGDRSPAEAFLNGYVDPATGLLSKWEQIVKRVRSFRDGWRLVRRFSPDAMERFEDQDAFRARFATDTSYIAKTAAQYLRLICPDVRAVNGHIVHEVRHQWGLVTLVAEIQAEEDGCSADEIDAELKQNGEEARRRRKSRADHRHHILDAIVTAAIPLNVVQQLQTAAGRGFRREDGPAVGLPGGFSVRSEAEVVLRRSRVVHRRDREVNKRLHQEMAWGVLARFDDGTYLARRHLRLTKDALKTLGDLDGLLVSDDLIQRLATDLRCRKAQVFWKAHDPVDALERIARGQADVREGILELYHQEPETEDVSSPDGSEPRRRKLPEPERLARALDRYRRLSGRRSALRFERRSLHLVGGADEIGKKPLLAYETKGNAWLDIRRDRDGSLSWEAVPRIIAINWTSERDREDPPVLRLFSGDTIEISDSAGLRQLCRVVSASTGDIQLLPVNDARPAKISVNRNAFRYTSLKSFLAAEPIQVVCDPLGRVRWRDHRRNW